MILEVEEPKLEGGKFTLLPTSFTCTLNQYDNAIQNNHALCFYDSFNFPSEVCYDYSPVIALPADNKGIEIGINLTGLVSYSFEFWFLMRGAGSVARMRSPTSNPLFLITVNSITEATQFGGINFEGPASSADFDTSVFYKWHHVAAVYQVTAQTIDLYYDGHLKLALTGQSSIN